MSVNQRRRRNAPPSDEFARIAWLERQFGATTSRSEVALGIGDDAAILRAMSEPLVWTTDACVEEVHFKLTWLSPEDLGSRSYHAAVSDLAAMGAAPVGALSSLALPADVNADVWRGIARGQARAAKALGCPVIGGNLSRASEISIHTTAIGKTRTPLLRRGARVGDEIWLVGVVGTAAAGLSVLMNVPERHWTTAMRSCVNVWRRPKALLREGALLQRRAHSVIDISDGLAGDAQHIADASGVALVLYAEAVEETLESRTKSVARALHRSALEWALTGGEDYALLATGESKRRPDFARRIGVVEKGRGVWLIEAAGRRLLGPGFDHFSGSQR